MTTTRERALEAALRDIIHSPATRLANARHAQAVAALALPPSPEPQPAPVASEKWQFGQRGADKAGPFWRNVHIPGRPVATAFSYTSQNEADARARLIAAAPDMLAALREAVDCYERLAANTFQPGWRAYKPELEQWKAAIARATGREG